MRQTDRQTDRQTIIQLVYHAVNIAHYQCYVFVLMGQEAAAWQYGRSFSKLFWHGFILVSSIAQDVYDTTVALCY